MFTVTMSLGAAAWLIGNLLWLRDWPFPRVVPWWMAFLGLTIVGERLDLSRFQKQEPMARPLFIAALGLLLAGMMLGAYFQIAGTWLEGIGLIALACWLGRFDIARRTVKQPGLPRFMAASLLSGYVWLAFAGGLLLWAAPLQSGPRYDAALHAFFLGFVFSMIFGHAPVIFPGVLSLPPIPFSSRLYIHLGLLHLSLLVRAIGDLSAWEAARHWGAIGNGLAIGVFLLNTVASLLLPRAKPASACECPARRRSGR
jgi:hypothetical protein